MTGVPFVISETNHPYPHVFAAEGIPILTAYAMLHDWDGVVLHEWGGGTYEHADQISKSGWFHLSTNPMKIAQLMVSGLIWHRHDLQAAEKLVVRQMTAQRMRDWSRVEPWRHRPFFDDAFPRALPLVHRTRWQLADRSVDDPGYPAAPDLSDIRADTGQIRWHGADAGRGRVVIEAPNVQALIGFHRDAQGRGYRGARNLSVELENRFASIMLSSLDDQPISSSRRLLLFVADRAANQDLTWEDDFQTVAQWGEGPVGIRPVRGQVSLWGLSSTSPPKVTILDAVGRPREETWDVERRDGGWHLSVGKPAALLAIIHW